MLYNFYLIESLTDNNLNYLFEEYIIEVHISNIHKRESFRHNSYVSQKSTAVIAGFGIDGYKIALEKMINLCSS